MRPLPPDRLLLVQGGYYVATGVAPFLSRRLFERVTGPKVDWWLVQTVGVLVTAVGAGALSAAARGRETPEIMGIAAGCAAGLAALDTIHAMRGRISPVYLADAAVQLGLLAASPAVRRDQPAARASPGCGA